MSREIYIASSVENPPDVTSRVNHYPNQQHDYNSLANKPACDFVEGEKIPKDSKKRTWKICESVDKKNASEGVPSKRRLVSLFEANEVAKRVAGLRTGRGRQMVVNGGLIDEEIKTDVVSDWIA